MPNSKIFVSLLLLSDLFHFHDARCDCAVNSDRVAFQRRTYFNQNSLTPAHLHTRASATESICVRGVVVVARKNAVCWVVVFAVADCFICCSCSFQWAVVVAAEFFLFDQHQLFGVDFSFFTLLVVDIFVVLRRVFPKSELVAPTPTKITFIIEASAKTKRAVFVSVKTELHFKQLNLCSSVCVWAIWCACGVHLRSEEQLFRMLGLE